MMPARQVDAAPRVLITSTTAWPFPARIAMAFAELGWSVEALCWYGNPMTRTRCVRRIHHYAALRPIGSLSRAIAGRPVSGAPGLPTLTDLPALPDLIVPCDDRALVHLQALHARCCAAGAHALAVCIARSLGDPIAAAAARSRAGFIALARQEGVRAPLTLPVAKAADLRQIVQQVGLPAVLKLDHSWGGEGVAMVSTMAEAEARFAGMSRGGRVIAGLQRMMSQGDPFRLLPASPSGPARVPTRVNVQRFVPGRPANCIASCWEGQVLALIQVDVLCAQHAHGPSAVVQIADYPDIAEAARRVVGRLGLSGFCGLDFVIEEATGLPHLIEMNQRITPLGHLALGAGRDPVGALAARLGGLGTPERPAATASDTIAFFPDAWRLDPGSRYLATAYHDVPWGEPELVRALVRLPWQERSWTARQVRRRLTRHGRIVAWHAPARPFGQTAAEFEQAAEIGLSAVTLP